MFGETIRTIRKNHQMSRRRFAEMIGTSEQTLKRWEDDAADPPADNVKTICQIFGISPNVFFATEAVTETDDNEEERKALEMSQDLLGQKEDIYITVGEYAVLSAVLVIVMDIRFNGILLDILAITWAIRTKKNKWFIFVLFLAFVSALISFFRHFRIHF
ncbi:MAG: helix-turn-helix transcriptional regulator [Solobacterium sp.]|nr:helix-turn-helix transcriptional regulator [Solobacterium sp.]